MTCDPLDCVIVPFPFTDRLATKRRPAVVLSSGDFNVSGNTVMAMITSARASDWPGDTLITDQSSAGVPKPCIVRLKIFTLDNRLILKKIGHLGSSDAHVLRQQLRNLLPLFV